MSVSKELIDYNSEKLILENIRSNPCSIENFEKTFERCMVAVKQNGMALRVIPNSIQTEEMCIKAVNQNGMAIQYVSSNFMTNELCIDAVKNNFLALRYIPDEFKTSKLYHIAVKNNGLSLSYIPNKNKTKKLCMEAITQNGASLKYVPLIFLCKDFYYKAVSQNGLALEYVPNQNKGKKLCNIAIENNPLALKFVPDRYKTREICEKAFFLDWRASLYVLEDMYTLDFCLTLFTKILEDYKENLDIPYNDKILIQEIISILPSEINNNRSIISLERKLGARKFKQKYYNKLINKFFIKESVCYKDEYDEAKFDSFVDFYNYLEEDLKNANLYEYDFKNVNLNNFNIEGAYISSEILSKYNLYDNSFYLENIAIHKDNINNQFSAKNEIVKPENIFHEDDINNTLNDTSRKIYYISDIHINHKIFKKFPNQATRDETIVFIRNIVKKMVNTVPDRSYNDYLFIGGDISYSFEISKIFYSELKKYWEGPIIAILGNHELWNYKNEKSMYPYLSLEEIVNQYRNLFDKLGIYFLHNELLILNGSNIYDASTPYIFSEKQLIDMTEEELKKICLRSRFSVLGGLGFSGYNKEFNALSGIYRNTVLNLKEDINETNRFNSLYNKIKNVVPNNCIIVFTHTPKSNWSKEDYCANWIYVNGHTHRNEYYCDDEKTVYSDNQIGYYNTSIGLKFFKITKTYDIFKYYKDGIYTISREEYLEFNLGVMVKVTFNRTNGIIWMLKRNNIYCFIFENSTTGIIYLLNGGTINKLEYNDISYYFDRMIYYSDIIKYAFKGYNQSLKTISNTIKSIGGTGLIHGCIIDIDFLNHIYVNPIDGKITPYYATSIVDKYMYNDIKSLLLEQRKDLYGNFEKLLNANNKGTLLLDRKKEITNVDFFRYFSNTAMYGPSRIMKSIQYLTDINIIRIWKDDVIQKFMKNQKNLQ